MSPVTGVGSDLDSATSVLEFWLRKNSDARLKLQEQVYLQSHRGSREPRAASRAAEEMGSGSGYGGQRARAPGGRRGRGALGKGLVLGPGSCRSCTALGASSSTGAARGSLVTAAGSGPAASLGPELKPNCGLGASDPSQRRSVPGASGCRAVPAGSPLGGASPAGRQPARGRGGPDRALPGAAR